MSLDIILFNKVSSVNKLLLNIEFSEVFRVSDATENVLRGHLGDGLQKQSVRMCLHAASPAGAMGCLHCLLPHDESQNPQK